MEDALAIGKSEVARFHASHEDEARAERHHRRINRVPGRMIAILIALAGHHAETQGTGGRCIGCGIEFTFDAFILTAIGSLGVGNVMADDDQVGSSKPLR